MAGRKIASCTDDADLAAFLPDPHAIFRTLAANAPIAALLDVPFRILVVSPLLTRER